MILGNYDVESFGGGKSDLDLQKYILLLRENPRINFNQIVLLTVVEL